MFIQITQGRATNPPGIRRDLGRWQRQLAVDADGWLGSTTGITDDGWSVTVVRFASEAQARRNSDRPEQRDWWRDASQHLARVVVHDASKIHLDQDGGAEEAGFVRVVQGHSDDLARMVRAIPGQDARRLERESPIEAEEPAQENHRGLMADLRSFDLRDPQMLSPPDVPTY